MKKTLSIVLVILFGLCTGFAEDKEDPPQKEQIQHHVTVTANRIETSEKEVASSITVITRADLDQLKRQTVLEALEQIMGLSISQNGPPGSSANIFIRGANSEHTKVMIDGVEINDPISPGRTPDLGLLLVESIDRIEVLRGPQSTLYGSDAMAGVVNIITRQDRGKIQIDLSSRTGSYGTRSVNTYIGGGMKDGFLPSGPLI
ncbi:TonB-dependent receptor [Acidobacteriota bacterium]